MLITFSRVHIEVIERKIEGKKGDIETRGARRQRNEVLEILTRSFLRRGFSAVYAIANVYVYNARACNATWARLITTHIMSHVYRVI